MTTPNTIATIILFLVAAAIVTFFVRKRNAKVEAVAKDEYFETMEKLMRENKDTAFKLTTMDGRIRGQIVNWRIAHVSVVDLKTNRPLMTRSNAQHMITTFECDPEEVRQLRRIEEILEDIRTFRREEIKPEDQPRGYIEHNLVKIGKIVQYNIGDHHVLESNRVAITIDMRSDKTLYISEVHMSVNFETETVTSLDISTPAGQKYFEEEYLDHEATKTDYWDEFKRIEEINAELFMYNKHVNIFVHQPDSPRVIVYRPQPSEKHEDSNTRFKRLSSRV